MNIRKKKVEIPAGDRTMWEQSIFTKVWEFGKDGAAMVKKHYKNGLMLGVFMLALFVTAGVFSAMPKVQVLCERNQTFCYGIDF